LLCREKVIGALTLQSSQAGAFDDDDMIALQEVADVLAISLDNARLIEPTEEDRKEIRELHRTYLQQAWTGTAGASGDLNLIVENLSDVIRNASSEAGTVSRQETSEGNARDAGSMHPAEIELPLILRGQVIGQITLEADRASLSPEEMALIDSITTQTALALENARLLEDTQRRVGREQLISQMSLRFSRSVNVEEILKVAVEEIGKLPAVSEASIFLKPAEAFIKDDNRYGTSTSDETITNN
jgi:transcriptional regulator with GAF, ATPase, and Fis domain